MITYYHRKTKHFSVVKFFQQYMWNGLLIILVMI